MLTILTVLRADESSLFRNLQFLSIILDFNNKIIRIK